MAHDEAKWMAPATSSEVTRGLLDCRLAMIQIFTMILATRHGNDEEFRSAADKYTQFDESLKQIINEIGGLDAGTK